jgi:hypothetical protein
MSMRAFRAEVVLLAALGAGLMASSTYAEDTRATNPDALSLEVLGRGALWSVDYDRVLDEHLAAGLGLGTVSLKNGAGNATMIPAYVNYYLAPEQGSLFLTAGVTLATGAKNSEINTGGFEIGDTPFFGTFGIGYENRSDAGYLVRLAAYGMVTDQNVKPWGGISFGKSF